MKHFSTDRALLTVLSLALLAACEPAISGSNNGAEKIRALFEQQRSDVVVEAEGRVVAILPDDTHGSRHQRFLVAFGGDATVLVSHNIDLAPRVPDLRKGDLIAFRGEYEWNEKGGVIHWTHADPGGRRPGGWLRHEGHVYR